MSTDKISVAIIEEFIKKIRLASKSGQKEVKFPINEIENVSYHLNLIVLKLLDKTQNSSNKEEVISVVMDGGGFEEKR